MKKHDNCWLCGSNQIGDLYSINSFTFSKCKECTLCFIREMPDDDYLREYYTKEYYAKSNVSLSVANQENLNYAYKTIATRIKKCFNSLPTKDTQLKLLDLGCSTGAFFDFFPDWDVYGIELEEIAGKIAQEKYKNIFIGDMKDADFEDSFFDCITIQDALDHSNDPLYVVNLCYKLLKENGIIVIKVHNINCLLAKLTGRNFYAIAPPGHLTYFNISTLKRLLSISGFVYMDYYYNTQKLRLDKAFRRASRTFPFLVPVYKTLSKSFLGSIPFYKNYHDIITITGIKRI